MATTQWKPPNRRLLLEHLYALVGLLSFLSYGNRYWFHEWYFPIAPPIPHDILNPGNKKEKRHLHLRSHLFCIVNGKILWRRHLTANLAKLFKYTFDTSVYGHEADMRAMTLPLCEGHIFETVWCDWPLQDSRAAFCLGLWTSFAGY